MGKLEACTLKTNANKTWLYDQYYLGDNEDRKSGYGENHWTGAESIEWYTGQFVRDTMHGLGDYRWRHSGEKGTFLTYEGYFYANRMHGYGSTSYQDGRVFTGLFHSNMRWGPGVESQPCLRENVGLWRGAQLVRLTWRPKAPNVVPDLLSIHLGQSMVEPYRVILTTAAKTIGETNSNLELLKQCGSEPRAALEKWTKLYPKHCTDLSSSVCQVDVFDQKYYGSTKLHYLTTVDSVPEMAEEISQASIESIQKKGFYFAWNNNEMLIHMMKHCYQHESRRPKSKLDLLTILTGPRNSFKPAGQHELDCRTLIMASYLGNITNVAHLVNEADVHPDIADIQGNTALMYATCGCQPETIHFLIEAGANVDSFNDACCTPLGIALVRFACTSKEIIPSAMVLAMLPPPVLPGQHEEQHIFEWNISRELNTSAHGTPTKILSKTSKNMKASMREPNKKTDIPSQVVAEEFNGDSEESFLEEKRVYNDINKEYLIRVVDYFTLPVVPNQIPYIFEINDMCKEVDINEEELKKFPDRNQKVKLVLKPIKDTMKPSVTEFGTWQRLDKDDIVSLNSAEKFKIERLDKMMSTIVQLLSEGANINKVRCPQPALFIAIASDSPELLHLLIHHGADVNQVCSQSLGYKPIDLIIARPFRNETLEMLKVVLKGGARTNHRLPYGGPDFSNLTDLPKYGPTLFHAVLARKIDEESEVDVCQQMLSLLLEYNCDPLIQFKGRSALDTALMKNIDLLDIFTKSPKINLNAVINDMNQTLLVKMFSVSFFITIESIERQQIITNLLLFGADPLLECQNGDEKYQNIFVYGTKILYEDLRSPRTGQDVTRTDPKETKKDTKKSKIDVKGTAKPNVDIIEEYKLALELVTECARMLHIRWIQAKLVRELVNIINDYKHRSWCMIIKEHKNKKKTALWLKVQRSLEIWNLLKTTKSKLYNDKKILKDLLCIVHYYNLRLDIENFKAGMTAQEKNTIEADVDGLLREFKTASSNSSDSFLSWMRSYVKPELAVRANFFASHFIYLEHNLQYLGQLQLVNSDQYIEIPVVPNTATNVFQLDSKFKVCFECSLPLSDTQILCAWCKLVSFCSPECMKINTDRIACHPCSEYLKNKYFSNLNAAGEVSKF